MAGSTRALAGRQRCLERLDTIAAGASDPIERLHDATEALRRAIGWDWMWTGTFDPASMLPTSHLVDHPLTLSSVVPRTLAWPVDPDDPMVRAIGPPTVSLATATRGCLQRSEMWSACFEGCGMGDVVRVLCADQDGAWGGISPVRAREDRPFRDHDLQLLDAAGPRLAGIMRRVTSRAPAERPAEEPIEAAGLLLLDETQQLVGSTPVAAQWLARFPDLATVEPVGQLPAAVYAAAGAARSPLATPASSRVRLRDGSWAVIDAACVERAGVRETAVTIRPASGEETFDIVCRALGLTMRERQVGRCVISGVATEEIARRLRLSPHTVKVHLRTIFRKAGVTSRGELVALLIGRSAVMDGGLDA